MALGACAKAFSNESGPSAREHGRLRGLLDLDFQRAGASNRTALIRSLQEPPLRVVRAFEREDGSALAHLHNVSGGVLGGDSLMLRVRLGQEASAQLTTTGATRIYRPRVDAPTAVQINEIFVGEDALLEYVPDPIIPFSGARFSQRTTIHLAPRAGLFWWEILGPGREARGEIFQYEMIEMITDIVADGCRIAAERTRLEPESGDPHSLARLGNYRYLASFYICRVGLDAKAWIAAEEQLRQVARTAAYSSDTLWGISALAADGVVLRCLAQRGLDASSGLHTIWRAAKTLLFHRETIPPRKVN
ncbi:MAG TPA: urease accessory protein UreD [Candidatus Dormibacteraeota bacterium]|nr:urease accessory protein UreD [Candidatus Dormibacteraeota bacterium]